jgi:hypothetical protein
MKGTGLPTGIEDRTEYRGPDGSFIYCSTQYLEFHNWADQAFDSDGELMQGNDGAPIPISRLPVIGTYATTLYTDPNIPMHSHSRSTPIGIRYKISIVQIKKTPEVPQASAIIQSILGEPLTKHFLSHQRYALNSLSWTRPISLVVIRFRICIPHTGAIMLHELAHFTQGGSKFKHPR